MHRIDTSTAQKDKFAVGKNGFTRGNPQTGTPATDLDDDYFDMLQEELAAVVESANITLDKSKRNQLLAAINARLNGLNLKSASQRDVGVGTNQIPDMSSFTSSKTTNGWQKLPGGLILQWGQTASVASEQNVSVTFPIAFPTNYILAYATYANTTGDPASPGATYVGQIRTSGNTSIFIRNLGPAIAQYNWLAIGY